MRPTNYHLFDFMDFDLELSKNESLWKACKPTAVYEKDGDVYITVPFQKQVLSNDMVADTSVPREEYTLILRQYSNKIIRLFCGFGDWEMTDQSEMLQFSERVQKLPLQVKAGDGEWTIYSADGVRRAGLLHLVDAGGKGQPPHRQRQHQRRDCPSGDGRRPAAGGPGRRVLRMV